MLGTFAKTFMTATYTRHPAFWEVEGFANKRDTDPRPRLTAAPKGARRGWFRRNSTIHPEDL